MAGLDTIEEHNEWYRQVSHKVIYNATLDVLTLELQRGDKNDIDNAPQPSSIDYNWLIKKQGSHAVPLKNQQPNGVVEC